MSNKQDTAMTELDRLTGTWKVSGEATGQVTYSWLVGRHFLKQEVDLQHAGRHITGIEIIGREKPFGAEEPGEDITSRFYGSQGETLDYVYEINGDTLTIWGGEKGSPAYYRALFSPDGNSLSGDWIWPGGGYHAELSRVR
ncbi:hypothetical protein OG884_03240 [Streptosporangium sp. NBC_01755]|uniref:hypothetical protein n=1 Tax=unclassified Streptosporangium TaxID=2632669 RepID=UPI002DD892B4|nr:MULTISPECIES: hypothetical protein [unclassified Streptosporangium]WSA27561.1 hypothetical protein OIE13_06715 [Streptosporangium sp. NBC_01810]WSD00968.1 hypothetical protein OG884_03240 [Streptosporangium sp. NBC_01755]